MPFSDDDFIHENSGNHTTGTSCVVSLAGADSTTDGNVVFVFLEMTSPANISAFPAGFSLGANRGSISAVYWKAVGAGETSWTFTLASSGAATWYVVEMSNVDTVEAVEVSTSTVAAYANGATVSTGTTARSSSLSVVAFAMFGAWRDSSGATQSWSGYTNGFEEVIDMNNAGTVFSQLAVARLFHSGTVRTFETTATLATDDPDTITVDAVILVVREQGSPVMAPLAFHTGFEYGTHAGTAATAVTAPFGSTAAPVGTWGTNYLVQAGSARNGGYGLRIVQSAAAARAPLGNFSSTRGTFGFNVRVVSATGTVVVASPVTSGGTRVVSLLYDATNSKFGMRFGDGGSPTWQSGTTATNTWVWVEFGVKAAGPTWIIDWQIETGTDTYTPQTRLSSTSGASSTMTNLNVGHNASQTATFDFDDVCIAALWGAYPLSPHKVTLLVPETTGASVSGTSTNFNQFTNNGTLAAFASTNGALIDEVPPTISASSDGVVQVATAASDYMNFPMTTYTCAVDEVIAAVRMLCSEWGGTGSGTGTLGFRGHDGTTETTFVDASVPYDADSLTTPSSTYPSWKCAMWIQPNGFWTQAKLNAAALRIGFSTDATPDMGISAAYLEVAIRKALPFVAHRLTDDEDPGVNVALVTEQIHPYNSGVRSYTVSNDDPTRSVQFDYDVGGAPGPDSPVVVAPPDPPVVVSVNAEAYGEVTGTSFKWI